MIPSDTSAFLKHPEVLKCIALLEEHFGPGGSNLVLSDVVDSSNHQYVNLVQKGGGVLGVALVGYTYVLEKMGIRFVRLAGTSAGAINTALLAVINAERNEAGETVGNKKAAKSEKVLEAMQKLPFDKLVDGNPVARWLIKRFITHAAFGKTLIQWIKRIGCGLVTLTALSLVLLSLRYYYPPLFLPARWIFTLTLVYYFVTAVILLLGVYLLRKLKNAGYGINPGNYLYTWVADRLNENGVRTVADLIRVAETPVNDLQLRPDIVGTTNGLEGDVTFIASELVTQNKIEFPRMWKLFATHENQLSPAGFVRASMAIPLFFESYFIKDIPCSDERIKEEWKNQLGETEPPSIARFVDGGILSNLPISLFYNPAVVGPPRLPSFGIDLDDTISPEEFFAQNRPNDAMEDKRNSAGAAKSISDTTDAGMSAANWSLVGYLYRIFNTIRFYYDKDFLIKNRFYRKGIGTIPLKGFGWLNSFLSEADKINLFVIGAQAATRFLLDFDWESYKNQRREMQEKLVDATV